MFTDVHGQAQEQPQSIEQLQEQAAGVTRLALELAKIQTVCWEQGMVRQIGSSYGADPDVLGRSLQRMVGWYHWQYAR